MNEIKTIAVREIKVALKRNDFEHIKRWVSYVEAMPQRKGNNYPLHRAKRTKTYKKQTTQLKAPEGKQSRQETTKKQLRTKIREELAKGGEITVNKLRPIVKASPSLIWKSLQGMHHVKCRTGAHGEYFYSLDKGAE